MNGVPDDQSPIQAKLAAPPPADLSDNDSDDSSLELKNATHGKLNSRFAVLCILFLVTGAIGIPLLWVNPNFSRTEQVFWTLIVSLYTLSLLAVFGGVIWWVYRQLIDLGVM